MFSHIMVGANDISTMIAFYDAVLRPLGLSRVDRHAIDHPAGVIWQRPGQRWPQFAVRVPFNNEPASYGNGVQISFAAQSQEIVRAVSRSHSRTVVGRSLVEQLPGEAALEALGVIAVRASVSQSARG